MYFNRTFDGTNVVNTTKLNSLMVKKISNYKEIIPEANTPILLDNSRNWLSTTCLVGCKTFNNGRTNYHGYVFVDVTDGAIYFMPLVTLSVMCQIRWQVLYWD